jgi:cobalt/nickel transport protein
MRKSHTQWVPGIGGLLLALAIAALLSPWASPWPDGLDRVSRQLGFHRRERKQPIVAAPLADYKLPAAREAGWSTPVAGVTGTLAVFSGTCLLGYVLTRRRSRP